MRLCKRVAPSGNLATMSAGLQEKDAEPVVRFEPIGSAWSLHSSITLSIKAENDNRSLVVSFIVSG